MKHVLKFYYTTFEERKILIKEIAFCVQHRTCFTKIENLVVLGQQKIWIRGNFLKC